MGLEVGERLGPYEVLGHLGSGGMGEVYRARDPRLGREVALKISSERFSERFEREARVIASLNHPNICHVYDVGPNYLVMELIEGSTPAGPMSLEEGLGIARQVAAALEAAHEKGIVHRDLKPANIRLTPSGNVKVLDFGLAKLLAPAASGGSTENSPTVSISSTQAGLLLGTVPYMAPEQARGKVLDKRADIWAFGAVLYELLTGERLFAGEDVSETLAAVLKAPVDFSRAPVQAHRLLSACLERDPARRLRDIGDAWRLLDEAPAAPIRSRSLKAAWISPALLAIAAAGAWLWPPKSAREMPSLSVSIVPPAGWEMLPAGGFDVPEISPDGSKVLFATSRGLAVRRLDSMDVTRVLGSEDAVNAAFWSPDSRAVLFPTAANLVRAQFPDGSAEAIAPVSVPTRGGSVHANGTVLLSAGPLSVLTPSAGRLQSLDSDLQVTYPEFLAGSDDFLFFGVPFGRPGEGGAWLATYRDGKVLSSAPLLRNPTALRYTPAAGGRVLFVRNDNLYHQKLNVTRRVLEGDAVLIARGVSSNPGASIHRAAFSVAANGTVVWRPGGVALSQAVVFDRQGRRVALAGPAGSYTRLALSPDETRLLLMSLGGAAVVEVGQSGVLFELPSSGAWQGWMPSGAGIFGTASQGLVETSATGADDVRVLAPVIRDTRGRDGRPIRGRPSDVSRDGKRFLLSGPWGIVAIDSAEPQASRQARWLVESRDGFGARFSPDGAWFVYFRARENNEGIFVQQFQAAAPPRQIAPTGRYPVWRADGKEILYQAGADVMCVTVERGAHGLRFSAPRRLFSGLRAPAGVVRQDSPLDVSRDGSRIFWLQGPDQSDSDVIHVRTAAVR
jgi:eukaryotic-like serine/threonine-protein kinase